MGKYYTAPPQVIDGDIAYARDVNDVNNETAAGFIAVEADILAVVPSAEVWAQLAQQWAAEDEDVEVVPGLYSSLHYSIKSNDSADASSASAVAAAASAALTALDVIATNADVVLTNADVVLTHADVVLTNADVVATGLDVADTAANVLAAEGYKDEAYQWANEAEDVVVSGGEYSAYHWSKKAEISAGGGVLTIVGTTDEIDVDSTDPNNPVVSISANFDVGVMSVTGTADEIVVLGSDNPVLALASAVTTEVAKIADKSDTATTVTKDSSTGAANIPAGTTAQRPTGAAGQFRFNSTDETFEGYDGTEWGPIGGGGGLTWVIIDTDTTAEADTGYLVDTSAGAVTLTLPATGGSTVGYKDYSGTFNTYNLTVARNGHKIQGLEEDLTVDQDNAYGNLTYSDTTEGWLLTTVSYVSPISSKPLLHLQDQKATGTAGGTSSNGWNDRDLNTILTNEIAGSSLSSNQVTLPAGTYYIEASADSYRGEDQHLSIRDSSDTQLLRSINNRNSATELGSLTLTIAGQITLSATTTIKLSHNMDAGYAASGFGIATSLGSHETYAEVKIWQLDKDKVYPNVDDDSVALSKPFLHAQHQEASGTDGGASIIGDNDRTLNTLLTNEISGASLSSNEVTLPAGKYYIDSSAACRDAAANRSQAQLKKSDDTVLLVGLSMYDGGFSSAWARVTGHFTLTESTTVKLVTYTTNAESNGLGVRTESGEHEVYVDFKVWKIDALAQTPIVYQPINQPITGAYTTGNIWGGELEYSSATQFKVKAVSCMDDTNAQDLVINAETTVTLLSPAINTVYNAFLVRETGDTYTILYDTDVDGANLPGTVTHKRWLGFVLTDASAEIVPFKMSEDSIIFTDSVTIGSIAAAKTQHDISSFVPLVRVKSTLVGSFAGTGTADEVFLYQDHLGSYATKPAQAGQRSTSTAEAAELNIIGAYFWSQGPTDGVVSVREVRLKR